MPYECRWRENRIVALSKLLIRISFLLSLFPIHQFFHSLACRWRPFALLTWTDTWTRFVQLVQRYKHLRRYALGRVRLYQYRARRPQAVPPLEVGLSPLTRILLHTKLKRPRAQPPERVERHPEGGQSVGLQTQDVYFFTIIFFFDPLAFSALTASPQRCISSGVTRKAKVRKSISKARPSASAVARTW